MSIRRPVTKRNKIHIKRGLQHGRRICEPNDFVSFLVRLVLNQENNKTADNAKFSSKLHGSRILVVGGSAGVGYAVAEASLEQDATVVIISGSNPTRVANSIARLKASYPSKASRISGFASDLAQENELEANIVALLNAATNNGAQKLDVGDVDLNYIKASFLVRSFAAMLLAKHASKYLVPGPSSSLTLTSGTASIRLAQSWPALSAVTSSVRGLVAALALDLRLTRINAVTLGVVNTETFQSFWADKTPDEKEKLTALTEAKTLTGAVGKPEDVAEAYIYCMRDHNITGASVDTNSGQLLL